MGEKLTDLIELAERCERGNGSDRELDCLIGVVTDVQVEGTVHSWRNLVNSFGIEWAVDAAERYNSIFRTELPRYTASLDACAALLERVLPGFWWRGGTCFLSSEATVCPDHNCPTHGARLMAECPPSLAHWNEGIEVEIRPGTQGALVRALLAATLRALSEKDR